jgi:hypothetical protein
MSKPLREDPPPSAVIPAATADGPEAGSAGRPLRIVFFMRHQVYTRNFESTLRRLAERGHSVYVGFDRSQTDPPGAPVRGELIERLAHEYPQLTYGRVPWRQHKKRGSVERGWFRLEAEIGRAVDFLRYLEPDFASAPKLRRRAEQKAGQGIARLARLPLLRGRLGRRALRRGLLWAERALPTPASVDAFLGERDPDMVLFTPLVDIASPQAAYVRSAKGLGLRTALCVHSWDNLTNKGLIRDAPDFVTVWNEGQRREAIDLHGVPAERVAVTGAPGYDQWFGWRPSRDRETFCRTVGLDSERPYLLYLCSSSFIAPREVEFVRDWVARLRAEGGPAVRGSGVLVRPHPKNVDQWAAAALEDLGQVAVWPRHGADPLSPKAKADFFDSMHHCGAVVGINTSALIESAIVGRPVHTLLAPEFSETQEGTLHFHHLTRADAGLLHVAETFEEHAEQLASALDGGSADDRGRRFVRDFVRPHGLDVAATDVLVDVIEAACSAPRPPARAPGPAALVARAALWPLAAAMSGGPLPELPQRVRRRLVKLIGRTDAVLAALPGRRRRRPTAAPASEGLEPPAAERPGPSAAAPPGAEAEADDVLAVEAERGVPVAGKAER